MTKLAILRRQCIRAKRTLMRRWPNVYYEECFEDAKNEHDMLDGTPIYWYECSPEGECDSKPAVEELRQRIRDERTDWGRLTKQMDIRQRHCREPLGIDRCS